MVSKIDHNYIKRLAYAFILREGITSIPVNSIRILKRRHYYLRPYDKIYELKATPEQIAYVYGDAFVYPTNYSPKPYGLGINMNCSLLECNYTIMHELAHIELGHVNKLMSASGILRAEQWAEDEVELFCLYVMCPDIILQELGIKKADEIARICCVPYRKARLKEMYLKKISLFKTFRTPTEQLILQNFKNHLNRIS